MVWGAGRTDAGAHALGQVAHVHYGGRPAPERLRAALNAVLPADVSVVDVARVDDSFHARYSARWRRYRYRWYDRPARPALDRRAWHVPQGLDQAAMAEAARVLRGTHDWTTFCSATEPEGRRTRTVRQATVVRAGHVVELDLLGEGFLRGLVRGIAGALTEVGLGRRDPAWLGTALRARDRRQAAKTAPARGLVLVEVLYAEVAKP